MGGPTIQHEQTDFVDTAGELRVGDGIEGERAASSRIFGSEFNQRTRRGSRRRFKVAAVIHIQNHNLSEEP